eukprot:TRINITY_DN19924_c0_g1_i5.p1 TRINITY_DN19924_c0_g1~~TRINITY_DN19924_c0_g1_i5.p1  ORF type:complete len:341 (-),score=25.93 TRINITY_DN19924_c0_g1_i5:109-1131(-)
MTLQFLFKHPKTKLLHLSQNHKKQRQPVIFVNSAKKRLCSSCKSLIRCIQQQQLQLSAQENVVEYCDDSNWKSAFKEQNVVVALGKFDAMHLGHRQLAIEASELGHPFLLSFSNMAEVLGWPARLPLVPEFDRPRILKSWAQVCNGVTPKQRFIPFQLIRNMPPDDFVKYLVCDLGVVGIVAGENYRFGYKATGDTESLEKLGKKYGISIKIVQLLKDGNSGDISSSHIRNALNLGDLQFVENALQRKYRLILNIQKNPLKNSNQEQIYKISQFYNQPPRDGTYIAKCRVVEESKLVQPCDLSNCPLNQVQIYDKQLILDKQFSVQFNNCSSETCFIIEF